MFKCAMYVTHQEWANGKLMKEEPEEIIMSQQPTNILFSLSPGGFKEVFPFSSLGTNDSVIL